MFSFPPFNRNGSLFILFRKGDFLMKHRTEQQMMDLILGFARRDDRVRAVWLNGSRANPKAPRDQFQDFDIVYAVTDT